MDMQLTEAFFREETTREVEQIKIMDQKYDWEGYKSKKH